MLLEFLIGLGRKPRIIRTVAINRQLLIPSLDNNDNKTHFFFSKSVSLRNSVM